MAKFWRESEPGCAGCHGAQPTIEVPLTTNEVGRYGVDRLPRRVDRGPFCFSRTNDVAVPSNALSVNRRRRRCPGLFPALARTLQTPGPMTKKTIVQSKFDQMAKAAFWNALRPRGFKREAYNFLRQADGFAQVLNLQRYVPGEPGNVHFTINVGLFFPEYKKAKRPNQELSRFPKADDCALRFRIGELMNVGDIWFDIDAKTDEGALVKKMSDLLDDHILPFFDKYSRKQTILDALPKLSLQKAPRGMILRPGVALILLAQNGRTKEAKLEYERMLIEYRKDPDWVLSLGERHGFNVDPEPGEVPKPEDARGAQKHPLKRAMDKLLSAYRDIKLPEAALVEYDLRVSGDKVTLNIDGDRGASIEGQMSAWMFLCSQYWAHARGKEVLDRYPDGDLEIEDYDTQQRGLVARRHRLGCESPKRRCSHPVLAECTRPERLALHYRVP